MTITGRTVALALLGVVPVLLLPDPRTATAWLLLVVLLAAVDALLAASPRDLVLRRGPARTVRQGTPSTTTLHVTAGRRRARGTVRDAWQPSAATSGERHAIDLRAGASTTLSTTLVPTRRGDVRTDLLTMRLLGPLRLGGRQRSIEVEGTLRVLPAFTSRRHLAGRLVRLRQIDGRAAVRVRGQGTEFDSLREYVEGDDVRSIDWRASARRQGLVVRTWQPERDRRIALVVDTSRLSAGRVGNTIRLDAAIESALLLTALAARAGDHVDLVAGDRRVRAQVTGAPRTEMLARVCDALADVRPALYEADWQALVAAVAAQGRRPSLVVLVTPLEPAAVAESLLPVLPPLARRQPVVIASCADTDEARLAAERDPETVYAAAAAEQAARRRADTADALARLGVGVVDAAPDALPPALADHYLALKARGLL